MNVADDRSSAENFVEVNGWDWPQVVDPDRQRARHLGADYQPHVIVLGPDGEVLDRYGGQGTPADWEALAERVEEKLAG
ncbi:MAG TPA: hypothetical protein VM290_10300 [Gaiellaceae bacterium]|nr:hypothetical protein [Gaiellaceae bacterium]